MRTSVETLRDVLTRTLITAGMHRPAATVFAAASVDADQHGKHGNGVGHIPDYLAALKRGSLNGAAEPSVDARGAIVSVDADEGIAHFAFHSALDDILGTARANGTAIVAIHNSFTTGELGWYARTLATHGLITLVTTNSPALVALGDDGRRTVGTNPLAFAVPETMTIDQALSPRAFQDVRRAAARGESLPEGWAVDSEGQPTTSAQEALTGSLLPFGGRKGANIGLISETLALLAGATPSVDAPSYTEGDESPAVGLFALALDPEAFGENRGQAIAEHLVRLSEDYGVYLPGHAAATQPLPKVIEVDDELWAQLNYHPGF